MWVAYKFLGDEESGVVNCGERMPGTVITEIQDRRDHNLSRSIAWKLAGDREAAVTTLYQL